jgi:membrane protein required for colicin V production
VTLFDLIVVGLLALSALVGFVRGAVREVVTVAAFAIAALLSIFSLRLTRPLAERAVDPDWAAPAVAVVLVFVLVYVALRVLGGRLTERVQKSAMGPVDRAAGVGLGLLRGLVVLGVFHLVFHAVTPSDRVPRWISGAVFYPMTDATSDALKVLAREGSGSAGRFGPAIERAVRDPGDVPPQADEPGATPDVNATPESGYDPGDRRDLDALVEERAR